MSEPTDATSRPVLQSIRRDRTAMVRSDLSRPVALALQHGVLRTGVSLFDYGCGRGGDVKRLRTLGFDVAGWDPAHSPHETRRPAEVVNLGFVLNVIERPHERVQTLRAAWALAEEALVVAVRPDWEIRQVNGRRSGDGILTAKGTFQKFFTQDEIRSLIEMATGTPPVAVAPGVFFAMRNETSAQDLRARLVRSRVALPRITLTETRFEQNRDLLDPFMDFVGERGRLPLPSELATSEELTSRFGSLQKALAVVRHVEGDTRWEAARRSATNNLVVILALAAFRGRPKLSDLSDGLQADVRALFGSYKTACAEADRALYGLGDTENLDTCLRTSPVGKRLPDALYVHASAVPELSPTLRLYEGCAQALVGEVVGANVIKLSRVHRRVSYLSYPDFDRCAHPALAESLRVDLQSFGIKQTDFRQYESPPILHRKEVLVTANYPGRTKFERLTKQEERRGLLDVGRPIGTKRAWEEVLGEHGVRLSGHRLVEARA